MSVDRQPAAVVLLRRPSDGWILALTRGCWWRRCSDGAPRVRGMLALLLWLIALSPREAVHVVTTDPGERAALLRIGWRESRLRRIGRHKVDARPRGWRGPGLAIARSVGSRAWARAVQRGLLDPQACPWHDRGEPSQWSTRGPWGLVAAYSVPYLPGCWPAWALDVPVISALVAVQRLRVAMGPRSTPGLRRWIRA